MRHLNAQILAHYSGLLMTVGTVVAGYIFMPDIHAFIHPQQSAEPQETKHCEEKFSETELASEESRSSSPVSQESANGSSLSLILHEDEMIDIEAELERKSPRREINISTPFGLFEAIEDNYSDIPGEQFAKTLRYMMRQTYFYGFFGIVHDKEFKKQVEKILNVIELAKDKENTDIYIPQCYQLFRNDVFYRINHLSCEPKPQSPFTPLF
jgi:hypothetical protein